MKITLPFPPQILSPNSRAHWRKRMPEKNTAKLQGMIAGKNLDFKHDGGEVFMVMKFYPPRNSRDLDNCMASAKAHADGLAQGMKVNDKYFRIIPWLMKADKDNPRIEISILNKNAVSIIRTVIDSV